MSESAPTAKFQTARAVFGAYAALFGNMGPFAYFVAVWTAVGAALLLAAPMVMSLAEGGPEAAFESVQSTGSVFDAATIAEIGVTLVAAISVSISWHRFIILQERPGHPLPAPVEIIWRYTWRALLLSLLPLTVVILIFWFASNGFADGFRDLVSDYAIYLVEPVALAAMARLYLVLPSSAVGDDSPTFAGSWHLTRGSTLPLFWGVLACDLPFAVVNFLLSAWTADFDDGSVAYRLSAYATTVVDFMSAVVGAAFLSFAYLHFTRANAADRSPASYFE